MADLAVVRWLQAGAVAAGVGAAMLALPAIASADDGGTSTSTATSGRGTTHRPAAHPRSARATAHPVAAARQRVASPARPAAASRRSVRVVATANDDPSTSTEIVTG